MEYRELAKEYFPGRVWGNCLTIGISTVYWGYYLGVLATPINNISYSLGWGSDADIFSAVFSALFPLGATIGSVIGGSISNSRGRRFALMLAAVFGIISSAIHAIPYTATFGIGRFSCGVAGGLMGAVSSLFIAEISPTKILGKTGTFTQTFLALGIFFSLVIGIPLPVTPDNSLMNNWWILMVGVPAIFPLIQLILFFTIFKHEPASWLLSKNLPEEASSSVNFFYTKEHGQIYLNQLKRNLQRSDHKLNSINSKEITEAKQVTFSELLCCKAKYSYMMFVGVTMFLLMQLSGINAITNYSGLIFSTFADVFLSRVLVSILTFNNVVFSVLGVPLFGKTGKRLLLIMSSFGLASCLLALGLIDIYKAPIYVPLVFIAAYYMIFQIFANSIFILASGIMNDKGLAICFAINWFAVALVQLTFPFLIKKGLYVAFFLYSSVCLYGLFFALIFLNEHKGQSKEEIMKQYLRLDPIKQVQFEIEDLAFVDKK